MKSLQVLPPEEIAKTRLVNKATRDFIDETAAHYSRFYFKNSNIESVLKYSERIGPKTRPEIIESLIHYASNEFSKNPSDWRLGRVLDNVVKSANSPQLGSIIDAAPNIWNIGKRAAVLLKAIPLADSPKLGSIIDAAQGIQNARVGPGDQPLHSDLAGIISGDITWDTLRALEIVKQKDETAIIKQGTKALTAPINISSDQRSTHPLRQRMFDRLRESEQIRGLILHDTIPYADKPLQRRIVDLAADIWDEPTRSMVLHEAAKHAKDADPAQLLRITDLAAGIQDEATHGRVLQEVIPRADKPLQRRIVDLAADIRDEAIRGTVLHEAAKHAKDADPAQLLRITDLAAGIQDEAIRGRVLQEVIPRADTPNLNSINAITFRDKALSKRLKGAIKLRRTSLRQTENARAPRTGGASSSQPGRFTGLRDVLQRAGQTGKAVLRGGRGRDG